MHPKQNHGSRLLRSVPGGAFYMQSYSTRFALEAASICEHSPLQRGDACQFVFATGGMYPHNRSIPPSNGGMLAEDPNPTGKRSA